MKGTPFYSTIDQQNLVLIFFILKNYLPTSSIALLGITPDLNVNEGIFKKSNLELYTSHT